MLPLILDLLLWAGPRISVQQAFEAAYQDAWLPLVEMQPAEMQELAEPLTEQLQLQIDEASPDYLPVVSRFSKTLLGDVLLLGVPSLIARQAVAPLPFDYQPPLLDFRSILVAMGVGLLLPAGWSVFGAFYRSMVAQQVRDDRVHFLSLVRRLPIHWLNLMGFMILLILLAIVVIAPFLMLSMVLLTMSFQLGVAAINVGWFVVIWLAIFCSFTAHGVLLNERWVLRALWDSIRVVQWNLSSTTMLWILVVGLNLGLNFLFAWAGLTTDVWFMIPAIAVHAFVNTALVSATFIYFKDRYRHWHEMRAMILSNLDQRVAQAIEQSENENLSKVNVGFRRVSFLYGEVDG